MAVCIRNTGSKYTVIGGLIHLVQRRIYHTVKPDYWMEVGIDHLPSQLRHLTAEPPPPSQVPVVSAILPLSPTQRPTETQSTGILNW